MKMPHRLWIAVAACLAVAISVFCCFYLPKAHFDKKARFAAEDEVYETVVRDMITPAHGQTHLSQLVFDDSVLTYFWNGNDAKSCQDTARKMLLLENAKLPYNSLADKVYRLLTRSGYDDSFRADTIQDFLEKSRTAGRLSQTFHTDLPKTFISAGSVHFNDLIVNDGSKSFEQLFPGASGIISFSHVGFDSTLHEAIVSTSFVCGMLCGSGHRYVLRKVRGHWEVVNKALVWVS